MTVLGFARCPPSARAYTNLRFRFSAVQEEVHDRHSTAAVASGIPPSAGLQPRPWELARLPGVQRCRRISEGSARAARERPKQPASHRELRREIAACPATGQEVRDAG